MHTSVALLVVTLCVLGNYVLSDPCKSCTEDWNCPSGYYCCDGQCALWPSIGDNCPCSKCPSGLACVAGRCLINQVNCSCTTVNDCSITSGGQGLIASCTDNKCQLVPSQPPFSYFTPGGPCGAGCQSGYCNANNQCDYNPVGGACTHTYYCAPGSGCFDNFCQPYKSFGEQCQYEYQCLNNYICRSTSSGQPAICTTKAAAGEYCTTNTHCDGIACINNVCTYPARGEPCSAGNCSPQDSCGYDYTCIAKNSLADGVQCTQDNQCQSSVCNGQCLPISTLGGYCNVTKQCPDGQCIDNKCYYIAYYGEACNATHACFDQGIEGLSRPCRGGVCPRYYSALGESCTSDAECAVGRCSSGVCDYPLTCETASDCGRNLACDCGQCTFLDFNPSDERYMMLFPFFLSEMYSLVAQNPTCINVTNLVVTPECESIIAKYLCFANCYSLTRFSTGPVANLQVDCATLTISSSNVARPPCCAADALTDCGENLPNCHVFIESQLRPLITRPSAPTSTPTSAPTSTPTSAPTSTPTSAPTSTPTSAPTSTPTSAPTSTPTSAPTTAPIAAPQTMAPSAPTPSSSPIAAPLSTPTSASCNCAEPTPLCDQQLPACVGLRVAPVVQCVELVDNQYTAYMTYINGLSSSVQMSDAINFLNVNVQDKVSQFAPGRPFTYPQSAFNVITRSAQQVSWYLDGFKLVFDIDSEELRCPQDVTFQMTSTATLDQLLVISDSIVGNLSEVMQVAGSRLNVTFSASTKRQATSSIITVIVKADQSSSETSAQVVLAFVESGFETFTSRVPAAAVASVTTVPPANEQSGSAAVTPPTTQPTIVSAPTDRGVISASAVVFANSVLLAFTSLLI